MRRIGCWLVLALLTLNLTGCGGGGIEEGVPADAQGTYVPEEVKSMENDMMKNAKAN